MSLKNYGVLKGHVIDRRRATRANAHYQVQLVDDDAMYRIAINVQSQLSPSEIEYLVNENFQHPITAELEKLPLGFKPLERKPGGLAIDFIRSNVLDRTQMKPLPFDVPGTDNDLNDKLDKYITLAMSDEEARLYAFGETWGPEPQRDKIFGFQPGQGIHDIHMNQSNVGKFTSDDGVYQDGALLLHFPSSNQWVGIFLKFQSQSWHTDDKTGHRIDDTAMPDVQTPIAGEPDRLVRIIAALVNPIGNAPEAETVTLLNSSPQPIDLAGWQLADRFKNKYTLSGKLEAGETRAIALPPTVQLRNQGGIITLLDDRGLKVDGVSYTGEQTQREGWTIVF